MKIQSCDFRQSKWLLPGMVALVVAVLPAMAADANEILRIAAATSTHNSGLTARLFPLFEKHCKCNIEVSVVGSGEALQMGRDGLTDILIVHARKAENAFMQAGYGLERHNLMHNDLVIVGPKEDPAGIRELKSAVEVFRKLAVSRSVFISRADDSGTNKKEMAIWRKAGLEPFGDWYYESGQDMKGALEKASAQGYYTLTDRGTWLASRNALALELLFEGDPILKNPYGVIVVKPVSANRANARLALRFLDWITSDHTKKQISGFTIGGMPLFHAD